MKTHRLFISHSWRYGDAYEKLVALIESHGHFSFIDYSAPAARPISAVPIPDADLITGISNKMRFCHAVIVLAGVYASYSDWIQKEIAIAQSLNKPIIGVAPWGAERVSAVVQDNADVIVRWNSNSIVTAVRDYGLTPA